MPMSSMNAGFGFPLPAQTALNQPLHFVQWQLQQMQMITGIAIQQQLQQQQLEHQMQYPQALHMSRVSPIAFAPQARNADAEASSGSSSSSSNSDSNNDEMVAGHEEVASNVAEPPTPAVVRARVLTPKPRPEGVASDARRRPFPKMISMEGTTTAAKAKAKATPSHSPLPIRSKKRRAASEGAKPVAVAKDECPSPPVRIRARPSGSASSAPIAAADSGIDSGGGACEAEDPLDLVGHSAGTLGDDKRKESAPSSFSVFSIGWKSLGCGWHKDMASQTLELAPKLAERWPAMMENDSLYLDCREIEASEGLGGHAGEHCDAIDQVVDHPGFFRWLDAFRSELHDYMSMPDYLKTDSINIFMVSKGGRYSAVSLARIAHFIMTEEDWNLSFCSPSHLNFHSWWRKGGMCSRLCKSCRSDCHMHEKKLAALKKAHSKYKVHRFMI